MLLTQSWMMINNGSGVICGIKIWKNKNTSRRAVTRENMRKGHCHSILIKRTLHAAAETFPVQMLWKCEKAYHGIQTQSLFKRTWFIFKGDLSNMIYFYSNPYLKELKAKWSLKRIQVLRSIIYEFDKLLNSIFLSLAKHWSQVYTETQHPWAQSSVDLKHIRVWRVASPSTVGLSQALNSSIYGYDELSNPTPLGLAKRWAKTYIGLTNCQT